MTILIMLKCEMRRVARLAPAIPLPTSMSTRAGKNLGFFGEKKLVFLGFKGFLKVF